jgi:hypothetical protein
LHARSFRRSGDRLDLAAEDEVLNSLLDVVIELIAVVPEKIDPVVLVRVM